MRLNSRGYSASGNAVRPPPSATAGGLSPRLRYDHDAHGKFTVNAREIGFKTARIGYVPFWVIHDAMKSLNIRMALVFGNIGEKLLADLLICEAGPGYFARCHRSACVRARQ